MSSCIKCLVWDLDHTLWHGTILEDEQVTLNSEALQVLQQLDQRGILLSIASKNDFRHAMGILEEKGVRHYFLYPQISFSSKVQALERIAQKLNIALDSLALIDDNPAERDEVAFSLPMVRCYDAADVARLPALPEFTPRFITGESEKRRAYYQADQQRNADEQAYQGPKEAFLRTLQMRFTIAAATIDDLQRAEELTMRTHQLNTTGDTYTYAQLDHFRTSDDHLLLVARLEDRYGEYGTIGLALVEKHTARWNIKLLLMSCRVMNRGVGTLLLNYILRRAAQAGASVQAEFVPSGRNRMMLITYTFAGFAQDGTRDERRILTHDGQTIQNDPDFITIC